MTFLTQPGRASPSTSPGNFAGDARSTSDGQADEKASAKLPAQQEILFLWAIEGSGKTGIYGLDLQRAINECGRVFRPISTGTLYSTLKKLRRKGWIDSYEGDALGGGARRVYYRLTESGETQLREVNQFFERLRKWPKS